MTAFFRTRFARWLAPAALALGQLRAEPAPVLPGTSPLGGDERGLSRQSIAQWDNWLLRELAAAKESRGSRWHRDFSSEEAYAQSVGPNREHLRQRIGAVDRRTASPWEIVQSADNPGPLAETPAYALWQVRWPALEGVHGEGLLFRPKFPARALVILLADADQAPESAAGLLPGAPELARVGRQLAESGALVLIPTLANRSSRYCGDEAAGIATNQTQREWITRIGGDVGRHIIGYEVEKIEAAIDEAPAHGGPVAVAGYGEGGLLALYAAAVDTRIGVAWVSGYFQPRERVWREPLYRGVWGLLEEFGDAELASLVAPRALIVEPSAGPRVLSPPVKKAAPPYARSASQGEIIPAPYPAVEAEWERTLALGGPAMTRRFVLAAPADQESPPFGGAAARQAFFAACGLPASAGDPAPWPRMRAPSVEERAARERRTVREMEAHAQALAAASDWVRQDSFWKKLQPRQASDWERQTAPLRQRFGEELIGEIPDSGAPLRARTRLVPAYSGPKWSVYAVALDALPGVDTWGYLLLPNDVQPGERRPVVVCQHGANGTAADTFDRAPDSRAREIYQGYAARLADEGFVVFSPYDPNSDQGEAFRQLSRKANLLRQSIFSLIVLDHARILQWLGQQPFVDSKRIALYGMSYGGKAAMRVPALLPGYCLSISAGDFNDYPIKMTATRYAEHGAIYNDSPEMVEFNLANTFSYAEMAALIAPRPFMVEKGYLDQVARTERVGWEYSKVQRLYFHLGIPDRTAIEYFDGAHMVYGHRTFSFLHHFLHWPPGSP